MPSFQSVKKVAERHFFEFSHSVLAPMARPAPHAGKALLRKRLLRICRTPPRGPSLAPAGQFTFWQKTLCAKWKPAKCRQRRKQQVGFEEAARLARLKGRGNRNAATVQCRRRPLGGKARSAAKTFQKSCLGSFFEELSS